MNQISKRLQTAIGMFDKCDTVADIGCDHGYLSIELLEQGVCNRAICSDVNKGPLENAKEHMQSAGLIDRCDLRLGDGLEKVAAGEADAIAILGMGGILMKNIIQAGMGVATSVGQLIVSPQSEIPEFRMFLAQSGFEFLDEEVVFDMGKYYFLIKCRYTGEKGSLDAAKAYIGPVNYAKYVSAIEQKVGPLYNYLMFRKNILEGILEKTRGTARGIEVEKELTLIESLLG